MPLRYRFKRSDGGEAVALSRIDDLICEAFGKRSDETEYSPEFNLISSIGDVAWATGSWNKEAFDKIVDRVDFRVDFRDVAMRFLNGEYVYECWVDR